MSNIVHKVSMKKRTNIGIKSWITRRKNGKGNFSINHRKKIGIANKGKIRTIEMKRLSSESRMGKKNHNFGKPMSIEQQLKIKKALEGKPRLNCRGKNHHNWKGGITEINHKIRTSLEYKLWRKAVFERDNYTCIWCGLKSGNGKAIILNADHIKPFADYTELRFAIDNGRTLCKDCHKKTGTWGKH